MKLPRNEIGISDILAWRDCPERFAFGMRRHEGNAPPESWSPANAYGSAIHDVIEHFGKHDDEDAAVQVAFERFAKWLDPSDMERLKVDLTTYQQRDMLGVRTLISERDARVPLFTHGGETYYFRFRLDRLYQRLDDETSFVHVDYKSSKWAKSEQEVHEDFQLWAYNFGIYELYPECESLRQVYEQLSYGQIPTSKSDAQREQIKEWLIRNVKAILADEKLAPSYNQWCPWCPLKFDCDVVRDELTNFAQSRIAAMMPREPKLKKDGTPGKQLEPWVPDPDRFDEYAELLPKVKRARQALEGFEEGVRDTIRALPEERRQRIGYRVSDRSRDVFTPNTQATLHEELGDELFYLTSISKEGVRRFYGDDKDKIDRVVARATKGATYHIVEEIPE